MGTESLAAAIRAVAAREGLTQTETRNAFTVIMQGEATPALIAALLMGLRVKGETADEVAGAASALRDAMQPVVVPNADSLVDTCGTGGGTIGTFNISTAAGFVAAAAGVRIAKHGNRSFTSKCGSADVLEALRIQIDVPVERLPGVLDSAGMMFMFAPSMHPAMRHVGPVRRELGIHTVMNIVGPLANPAGVRRQVVGVADRSRLGLIADALRRLGAVHAMVVHGEPGLDEISPLGPTAIVELRDGEVREWTLNPDDYGLKGSDPKSLAGGDPATNARIIESVLDGTAPAEARSAVLLNAAAAILVGGAAPDYRTAVVLATEALDSGHAADVLERLRAAGRGD